MRNNGRGFLSVLFTLMTDTRKRRQMFRIHQQDLKRALTEKHKASRRQRADRVRMIKSAELAAVAQAYDLLKRDQEARHAAEIEAEKAAWRAMSADRDRVWAEWRQEFGIKPRARPTRDAAGPPAPARQIEPAGSVSTPGLKDRFADLSAPEASSHPGGWKKRRSAEERRADRSYRPRDRKGPTLER